MSVKWRNAFFVFGLVALVVMSAQMDLDETRRCLVDAGLRFPAVMVLWAFLYMLNTASWQLIINAGGCPKVGFWWLYRITVSGFALNYATPMGLMGGEPYRIMELSPVIGMERASSSVILYVMTHIFSHFCFWALSIVLYVLTQDVNSFMAVLLGVTAVFCVFGMCFFVSGYRRGLVVRVAGLLARLPFLGKRMRAFAVRNMDKLETIDRQTAALHKNNIRVLVAAAGLELACRVCSAVEVYLVMSLLVPGVSIVQCVLILSFTSLFANLLFFMPLQIGGREGGFLMSAAGLGLGVGAGVFTALIVRLRELAWTGLGLLLIKCNGSKVMQNRGNGTTPFI